VKQKVEASENRFRRLFLAVTVPETNSSSHLKNGWLEDEFPFWEISGDVCYGLYIIVSWLLIISLDSVHFFGQLFAL